MIYDKTLRLCLAVIIASFLSCKNDGVDSEVSERYTTDDRIVPLAEYTEDNPREWGDIAQEHIPRVRWTKNNGRDAIVVEVPLKKKSTQHYIERIGVLGANGKEIVSEGIPRLPNPRTHAFFYKDDLPAKTEGVKVYIKCNLHSMWTVPLDDAVKKE
jgi:desulfoferrodoxin (superoxide reductase-like protein)